MSKRLLNLNTITESIFGIQQYQSQNNLQMDTEYRQMLKVLTKAMQGELTKRQYDCMYAYYFENKTQAQIAKELAIYRTTVSRMLSQAKKQGIVEIKINHFDASLFELEEKLKQTFGLTAVELIPTENDANEEAKEEQLAEAASAWIRRQLTDEMVIGLSW